MATRVSSGPAPASLSLELIARKCPGTPLESRGDGRRRRDLNPRGAMHPYLLSREAHSTGLCDVSSADYSRTFLPHARDCARSGSRSSRRPGGGRGIRTPGAIADTTVFKTVSFGHSDSPPDPDHPTGMGRRARPSARRSIPVLSSSPRHQSRRPKKFQDFLSGTGSSGWSSSPRDRAEAVGGHSGTRRASIAWTPW